MFSKISADIKYVPCYWNVDWQEAYYSPKEANERFKTQKKLIISSIMFQIH